MAGNDSNAANACAQSIPMFRRAKFQSKIRYQNQSTEQLSSDCEQHQARTIWWYGWVWTNIRQTMISVNHSNIRFQSRLDQRHIRRNSFDVYIFGGFHRLWIHVPRECPEEFQRLRSAQSVRTNRVRIRNRPKTIGQIWRIIWVQVLFGARNNEDDISCAAGFRCRRHGELG